MQVTINIPENLPETVIQQQIAEFEEKLRKQAQEITPITNKKQKYQAIMNIAKKCSNKRGQSNIKSKKRSKLGCRNNTIRLNFSQFLAAMDLAVHHCAYITGRMW
ncbi:MAG: hypothetical protein V3V18_00540 [Methylococcales bacterium]